MVKGYLLASISPLDQLPQALEHPARGAFGKIVPTRE